MSWSEIAVAVTGGAVVAAGLAYATLGKKKLPEVTVDVTDRPALRSAISHSIINRDHLMLDSLLTAAAVAAKKGDVDYASVKELCMSEKHGSLLCFACRLGRIDCARVLLNHGIAVDVSDSMQEQAVHFAARMGKAALLQLLIDWKADIHVPNRDGWTALHWTATNGRTDCTRLLLSYGADLSAVTKHQLRTPLHYAVQNGHVLDATILLSSGSDPTAVDSDGNCPLHAAAKNGATQLLHLILPVSGTIERNEAGQTPLQVAALRGNADFVIGLLHHSPDTAMQQLIETIETLPVNDEFRKDGDSEAPAKPAFDDRKLAARLEQMRKLLEKVVFVGDFGQPLLHFLTQRILACGQRHLSQSSSKDLAAVRNGIQQVVWLMEFIESINLLMAKSVVPDVVKHLDGLWLTLDERMEELAGAHGTRNLSAESAAHLGPILQAYYLLAKQAGKTLGSATPANSVALEPSFCRFVTRNLPAIHAIARHYPELLTTSFDFVLENASRPEWRFKELVSLVPFTELVAWFHRRLLWERAHHKDENATIVVPRGAVMQESCSSLLVGKGELFKGKFNVQFDGESGVGDGVRREWFQVVAEEMFNEDCALFVQAPDGTMQPNAWSHVNPDHLAYFAFVGRVIGLALYHGELLRVAFTRSFYKHILGVPVTFADLADVDAVQHRNLQWLLDNDVSDLCLTFSVDSSVFGTVEVVDLLPNGSQVAVTNDNKAEYVRLVTELRMTRAIEEQIAAFRRGFYEIVPHYVMAFDEFQLELLLSGLPQINVADWRASTRYKGFTEDDLQIQWFWATVEDMTDEQRAQLLQFATGTSAVPIGGFKDLRGVEGPSPFTITNAVKRSTDSLPTASTCFNLLCFPAYEDEATLRSRLLAAVSCGARGFEFS